MEICVLHWSTDWVLSVHSSEKCDHDKLYWNMTNIRCGASDVILTKRVARALQVAVLCFPCRVLNLTSCATNLRRANSTAHMYLVHSAARPIHIQVPLHGSCHEMKLTPPIMLKLAYRWWPFILTYWDLIGAVPSIGSSSFSWWSHGNVWSFSPYFQTHLIWSMIHHISQ